MAQSVFIGSADMNMLDLGDSSIASDLISSGVGLYGHGSGIFDLAANGWKLSSIMNQWKNTSAGSGVAEFGFNSGFTTAQSTFTNVSSQDIRIDVGQVIRSSNGSSYQVIANPGQPGVFSEGVATKNNYVLDNGLGYYLLKPGQSSVVSYESMTLGSQANLNNMTIGTSKVSNTNVLTSIDGIGASDITFADDIYPYFGAQGNDKESVLSYFVGDGLRPMQYLYQMPGFNPLQGNVNMPTEYMTAEDLPMFKDWVDAARSAGVLNLAPIYSANSLASNYAQDFATSAYWANTREAALYAGGLSFDIPPAFLQFTKDWFGAQGKPQDTYIKFVESQIKWANSEGLRTSIIVSTYATPTQGNTPYQDSRYGGLLKVTQDMVAMLKADGAMPSQFIVENYAWPKDDEFKPTDGRDSLQTVAKWLASQNLTVATNSESMQETPGSSSTNYAVHYIMTGVKPDVSVQSSQENVYDSASVFYGSQRISETEGTMTITFKNAVQGLSLAATGATVSTVNGNEVLSYSGLASGMSSVLKSLTVSNTLSSNVTGTAEIDIDIGDNKSTSIHGETSLAYTGSGVSIQYTGSNSVVLTPDTGYTTRTIVSNDGSLTASSTVQAYGVYQALTIQNGGSGTEVAALLNGTGIIQDTQGVAGVTVSQTGTLTTKNASAWVLGQGGSVSHSGTGQLTVIGQVSDLTASGNMNAQALLTGKGVLSDISGDVGLTLGQNASLSVEGSVAYITEQGASLTVGHGAYVSVNNSTGNNYNQVSGGVLVQSASDSEGITDVSQGTYKAELTDGYTIVKQDMRNDTLSYINGVKNAHGLVLATNLASQNDVRLFYVDNKAIVQEDNQAGMMVIDNVSVGGLSTYTNMNGNDFSQQAGSKSLMIAVDKAEQAQVINQNGTYAVSGTSVHVNGGQSTLELSEQSNTTITVDMASNAQVTLEHATSSDMTLLLKNVSGTVSSSFVNGQLTVTDGKGLSQIMLGNSNLSMSGVSTSIMGLDLSKIQDAPTVMAIFR